MQEFVDFGAFIKSKRSRDKIIKEIINKKLSLHFTRRACPITARQYGEVVLPDASWPEGSIPESGYKVSEAGKGGYGTCFCRPGTKFYYVMARSGYKFYRSRVFIPGYKTGCEHLRSVGVQFVSEQEICQGILDFNCVQMRESGCRNHYKFVFGAGVKAKTVTNNLPILSVLKGVLR
jgi:hypothetical protein